MGRKSVGCQILGSTLGVLGKKVGIRSNIDSILSTNLEGRLYDSHPEGENSGMVYFSNAMDHDLEDRVLIGEEGKKRQKGDIEGLTRREEVNSMAVINKGSREVNHLSSAAPKK